MAPGPLRLIPSWVQIRRPLFVVPSIGPPRPLEAHPEAFVVRALLDNLPHVVVDIKAAHLIPWDGHPDAFGAAQIADAIAAALAPLLSRADGLRVP